jgi:hypothetical protein
MNMGVPTFNIASSVLLITAQRLARRLCTCKKPLDPERDAAQRRLHERRPRWQLDSLRPGRCERCKGSRLQGARRHLSGHADHRSHSAHHHGQRRSTNWISPRRPAAKGVKILRRPAAQGQAGLTSLDEVLAAPTNVRTGRITRWRPQQEPAKRPQVVKEFLFLWEGEKQGRQGRRGEMRAASEASSGHAAPPGHSGQQDQETALQNGGRKITDKDIALFTRQLATMMKSGVPLLQAFDIVGGAHDNPAVGKLLLDIKADVETGSSLSQAFRKYPLHFDALVLQPGRRRRTGRYSGHLLDRWRPTRKR